jgi:hypothetical protein
MTEAEWEACPDPSRMLLRSYLRLSQRKRRLFVAACCRRVAHLLPDERTDLAIATVERFADGFASAEDAARAAADVWAARRAAPTEAGRTVGLAIRFAATPETYYGWDETAARDAAYAAGEVHGPEGMEAEAATQARLLRCVFGPLPFRPVAFDSRWRTADVVGLARDTYEDRAFDRLLLLADALMDAGCGDEQVLGHCRGGGPHVRGCWVVDLILDKD